MNVRDLKLAIACCVETEEIKSLNKFFDDLFSGISIYTKGDKPDLIFMKGEKFIMKQDLKNGHLYCRYQEFWSILEDQYHCTYAEIQEIISYKVEEAFKMGTLTPCYNYLIISTLVEEAFKMGTLTPMLNFLSTLPLVEEAFKMGALTPKIWTWNTLWR